MLANYRPYACLLFILAVSTSACRSEDSNFLPVEHMRQFFDPKYVHCYNPDASNHCDYVEIPYIITDDSFFLYGISQIELNKHIVIRHKLFFNGNYICPRDLNIGNTKFFQYKTKHNHVIVDDSQYIPYSEAEQLSLLAAIKNEPLSSACYAYKNNAEGTGFQQYTLVGNTIQSEVETLFVYEKAYTQSLRFK